LTGLPSFPSCHSHSPSPFPPSADSGHETKNVWDELLSLCLPHVTNSSYCIVEDTVLGTPFDALRVFFNLTEASDFCIDGDREYFGISQHRGGYLKRIDTAHKTLMPKAIVEGINRVFKANRTIVRGNTPRLFYERKKLEEAVEQVYHQHRFPSNIASSFPSKHSPHPHPHPQIRAEGGVGGGIE
jgi:hypothetical protein